MMQQGYGKTFNGIQSSIYASGMPKWTELTVAGKCAVIESPSKIELNEHTTQNGHPVLGLRNDFPS